MEFRFSFKAADLAKLMGGRKDIKTFSEAIAKLLRRAARQVAREPLAPTRRERADALMAEFEPRFPKWPSERPPDSRSLFDYVHPEFLPLPERRLQSYRVQDAREELPPVGPPRPDKLVTLPVDEDGPYVRVLRMKGWLPHSQRDTWADLDLKQDGGRAGHGDGDVLAYMKFIGVTPDEWEALPSGTRVSIRESIRDLSVIGRAVGVALDPLDAELAQRAVALLQKLSAPVAKNRRSPRGFEVALAQREKWAAGRGLHQFIVYLFDLVKEHFHRELCVKGSPGVPQLADEVNTLLSERYGTYAAQCTPGLIEPLYNQSSATQAKILIRRIDPKASVDSLGRAVPRHRSRKKKRRLGTAG